MCADGTFIKKKFYKLRYLLNSMSITTNVVSYIVFLLLICLRMGTLSH